MYKKWLWSSNLNFVLELYKIWNRNWPMTKEGSYLRGQESSNGLNFPTVALLNTWMVLVHLQKKKEKNEDLMLLKQCDGIIFFQVPWYISSRTVNRKQFGVSHTGQMLPLQCYLVEPAGPKRSQMNFLIHFEGIYR